jgi:dTDP-4-amino-4,6-dideoxygalactose transaminase
MYVSKRPAAPPAQSGNLDEIRIPLVRPEVDESEDIIDGLREILRSGMLSNFGPCCVALEQAISTLTGARYAVAVANGATGLVLLLNTLPRGGEVIVPSFTFAPTVQALLWNGLVPVFADIDPATLCISPDAVWRLITPRTSAILAVHMFGVPAAVHELTEIARRSHLALYFDSAHALGSLHRGCHVGSFGDAEVFSMSATKLVVCGEGGVITTNEERLYKQLLDARNYGLCADREDCERLGLNGKLPEFSALLGLKGLPNLFSIIRRRGEIAAEYRRRLSRFSFLHFQSAPPEDSPAHKDFVLILDDGPLSRDQFVKELEGHNIEVAPYFSPPVHQMTVARPYFKRPLPHTDYVSSRIVSLPIYSSLTDDEVEYVCSTIEHLLRSS